MTEEGESIYHKPRWMTVNKFVGYDFLRRIESIKGTYLIRRRKGRCRPVPPMAWLLSPGHWHGWLGRTAATCQSFLNSTLLPGYAWGSSDSTQSRARTTWYSRSVSLPDSGCCWRSTLISNDSAPLEIPSTARGCGRPPHVPAWPSEWKNLFRERLALRDTIGRARWAPHGGGFAENGSKRGGTLFPFLCGAHHTGPTPGLCGNLKLLARASVFFQPWPV